MPKWEEAGFPWAEGKGGLGPRWFGATLQVWSLSLGILCLGLSSFLLVCRPDLCACLAGALRLHKEEVLLLSILL